MQVLMRDVDYIMRSNCGAEGRRGSSGLGVWGNNKSAGPAFNLAASGYLMNEIIDTDVEAQQVVSFW